MGESSAAGAAGEEGVAAAPAPASAAGEEGVTAATGVLKAAVATDAALAADAPAEAEVADAVHAADAGKLMATADAETDEAMHDAIPAAAPRTLPYRRTLSSSRLQANAATPPSVAAPTSAADVERRRPHAVSTASSADEVPSVRSLPSVRAKRSSGGTTGCSTIGWATAVSLPGATNAAADEAAADVAAHEAATAAAAENAPAHETTTDTTTRTSSAESDSGSALHSTVPAAVSCTAAANASAGRAPTESQGCEQAEARCGAAGNAVATLAQAPNCIAGSAPEQRAAHPNAHPAASAQTELTGAHSGAVTAAAAGPIAVAPAGQNDGANAAVSPDHSAQQAQQTLAGLAASREARTSMPTAPDATAAAPQSAGSATAIPPAVERDNSVAQRWAIAPVCLPTTMTTASPSASQHLDSGGTSALPSPTSPLPQLPSSPGSLIHLRFYASMIAKHAPRASRRARLPTLAELVRSSYTISLLVRSRQHCRHLHRRCLPAC